MHENSIKSVSTKQNTARYFKNQFFQNKVFILFYVCEIFVQSYRYNN